MVSAVGWEGGMVQDRFSAQAGCSWLCRTVPGTRYAAKGSGSPRLFHSHGALLARRKKPSPMVSPFPPHHPSMHVVFRHLFGFFPFNLCIPIWFSFRFSAIFSHSRYFAIPFFFFHSFPPFPLSLDFPFHRLHTTSLDVMTNPG